jgi:hypothetical protein
MSRKHEHEEDGRTRRSASTRGAKRRPREADRCFRLVYAAASFFFFVPSQLRGKGFVVMQA